MSETGEDAQRQAPGVDDEIPGEPAESDGGEEADDEQSHDEPVEPEQVSSHGEAHNSPREEGEAGGEPIAEEEDAREPAEGGYQPQEEPQGNYEEEIGEYQHQDAQQKQSMSSLSSESNGGQAADARSGEAEPAAESQHEEPGQQEEQAEPLTQEEPEEPVAQQEQEEEPVAPEEPEEPVAQQEQGAEEVHERAMPQEEGAQVEPEPEQMQVQERPPEEGPPKGEHSSSSSSSSSSSKKEEVKPQETGAKMDQEIQKMDTSSSDSYYSDGDEDEEGAKDGAQQAPIQAAQTSARVEAVETRSRTATSQRKQRRPDDLPLNLDEIVFHSRESLTYKALLGVQLQGLPQTMLTSIVNDLRKYMDTAVDTGLIDEAVYIQKCIDNLRCDKSAEKYEAERELKDLDQKIQEAQAELAERTKFWDTEQAMMERELEMTLLDVSNNEDEALSELDRQWQSSRKQQLYSKPSANLLNLRHMAKKMIRIKNFEGVKEVAAVIEAREREETSQAAKRMDADYHSADAKMKDKYEVERANIIQNYEKRLHNLLRAKETNLRPINQRIQNLEKQRQEAATTAKKCKEAMNASAALSPRSSLPTSRAVSRVTRRDKGIPGQPPSQLPALMSKPKLSLPPITRIKRDGAKSQARTKKPPQKTLCRPQTLQRLSSLNIRT